MTTYPVSHPIEPRDFVLFSFMTCDCPLVWLGLALESATLGSFSEKPRGSTGWETWVHNMDLKYEVEKLDLSLEVNPSTKSDHLLVVTNVNEDEIYIRSTSSIDGILSGSPGFCTYDSRRIMQ